MTSSSDFWPKLVMFNRSSWVFTTNSPIVFTCARLRQLRGRSDRSRSSIGRPGGGANDLAEVQRGGLFIETGDQIDQVAQGLAGRGQGVGRRDRTIGLDIENEVVVVGALLNASGLNGERDATHRGEDGVD